MVERRDDAADDMASVVVTTDPAEFLKPLLVGLDAQRPAARLRGRSYETCSVPKDEIGEREAKNWQLVKKTKKKATLKRDKPHHRLLEDRVWMLLHRMGYEKINGERFQISFERNKGTVGRKQIDVFAFDNETAIVVECKSKETSGRKSLQKDILETVALKDYIRKSIYAQFRQGLRPKVVWIYATHNILWSENDAERAADADIEIITENEIQYFETFLKHMGPAGRYQVLAEFLKGQRIPGIGEIKIPAIRGKIGGETFYHFVTRPKDILRIAFVNHQALNNPDGAPAYQRMISSNRIKQIGNFIQGGGFFPTNLIVNFVQKPRFDLISNKENTDPEIKFGWLTLPNVYRSAWVIDGQHRLYGYSHLSDAEQSQSLFVLAFENMQTTKEANMFITINHEQKSVPKSLLVTLLADLKLGSDDPNTAFSALASAVVRRLNQDRTSPFFRRFALPGVTAEVSQNLTVSEVVKGMVQSGLLGKIVHKRRLPGPLSSATDETTIERCRKVLNIYFDAIRSASPERWDGGRARFISINPGIRAHLVLIAEIVRHIEHRNGIQFVELSDDKCGDYLVEFISPLLDAFKGSNDDRIKDLFSRKFGEGGVKEYLFNMIGILHKEKEDFGSDEFKRYVLAQGSSKVEEANKLVIQITEKMTNKVVDMLKSIYSEQILDSGEPAYWERGIPIRRVRDNAYNKQQADKQEQRLRKEAYLDVIDLKEIVEEKANWDFFKDIFSNPMPEEGKVGNKKYTGWMTKFNEVRRIPAHKNKLRTYSDEDYEFLDWVRGNVQPKLD